jgi:hypothetical protein
LAGEFDKIRKEIPKLNDIILTLQQEKEKHMESRSKESENVIDK